MKVLVFIVAYNAESHIESVLERIPEELTRSAADEVEILIIDDQSKDHTTETALRVQQSYQKYKLTILSNPVNQGYGGNQKLGYHYALNNGFEVVVLLHGDGQYAPELLPSFVEAFDDPEVAAVFGSRMAERGAALRGGMPLYKYAGNRILTTLQNWMLGQNLSEFHSGYRAYRVDALRRLPFHFNSQGFDFDTDIIIQLVGSNQRILEIPIPTYYGEEICHVNGLKYAAEILVTTLRFKLQKYSIVYHPKFDFEDDNEHYTLKLNQPSSHQWALDFCDRRSVVMDLGCGPGLMGAELRKRGVFTMGLDRYDPPTGKMDWFRQVDLDEELGDFTELPREPEVVLCLDIIEHLKNPEDFLMRLREQISQLKGRPEIMITTPNVAFGIMRLSLFLGQFNYGKRGILDATHTRLFTFRTLAQTMRFLGYEIVERKGIPPPVQLVFGSGWLGRSMSGLASSLVKVWPRMFAYQILVVARALPTLDRLLSDAKSHSDGRARGAQIATPVETDG